MVEVRPSRKDQVFINRLSLLHLLTTTKRINKLENYCTDFAYKH